MKVGLKSKYGSYLLLVSKLLLLLGHSKMDAKPTFRTYFSNLL